MYVPQHPNANLKHERMRQIMITQKNEYFFIINIILKKKVCNK